MIVFKFGGASLSSAASIRNVASIIQSYSQQKLIVVSAMGKTTDGLENIVKLARYGKLFDGELNRLLLYHQTILHELFPSGHKAIEEVNQLFARVGKVATEPGEYDLIYDQVVSMGEVISSVIIYHFLCSSMLDIGWQDARKLVATNSNHREAKVDWENTKRFIRTRFANETGSVITQGFIGSDARGNTTTLGREGSDFSAAIFGSCLDAKSVTIWKDVPGVMNADPKKVTDAKIFEELPYKEAAEMTYYGASIIHPQTIKPLANKGIPLYVKSFVDPSLPGTVIHDCVVSQLPTLIVYKGNQCLISCRETDFSFINEAQLGVIFKMLSENNVKINVMQNSAISLSFCVDFKEQKTLTLIEQLSKLFDVFYNTNLTLITLKNYDQKTFEEYRNKLGIVLEQSSRSTLQVLVRA